MHNPFKQSPGLFLLRRIRDEAHRFAITFQKQQRTKTISKSIFHDIKGMGDKRVKKLLLTYNNLKIIANLKPIEIQQDIGVSEFIAKSIIRKVIENI